MDDNTMKRKNMRGVDSTKTSMKIGKSGEDLNNSITDELTSMGWVVETGGPFLWPQGEKNPALGRLSENDQQTLREIMGRMTRLDTDRRIPMLTPEVAEEVRNDIINRREKSFKSAFGMNAKSVSTNQDTKFEEKRPGNKERLYKGGEVPEKVVRAIEIHCPKITDGDADYVHVCKNASKMTNQYPKSVNCCECRKRDDHRHI